MINKLNLYFDYLVQTGLNKSLISSIIGHKITGSNSFKLPWIQEINPQIIIDIGANTGQTATEMRKIFPKASIYSFEPIPACFEKLNQSMKGDKRFTLIVSGLVIKLQPPNLMLTILIHPHHFLRHLTLVKRSIHTFPKPPPIPFRSSDPPRTG